MTYKLIITQQANIHIDNIINYLVNNLANKPAAQKFIKELSALYDRLSNNPYQFQKCENILLDKKNYYKAQLSTMKYNIIFKIQDTSVFILGIFHNLENYFLKI